MAVTRTPTSRGIQLSARSLWGSIALILACAAWLPTAAVAAPKTTVPATPRMFPMELRISVPLDALPAGGPASDGERVYVPVRPTGLVAVSLATGEVVWRGQTAIARGPVYGGGRLFVTTADSVEAIDPTTGEATWRTPLSSSAVAAPVLSGDLVLVPLESGDVVAVRQADGGAAWKLAVGGRPSGPVLTVGDTFVAALEDGKLVGLTRATGQKKWEQQMGGPVTGLAGQGNSVYAGSLDNFFYCLEAGSGRIRWRWRTGADVVGEPSVDDERVYFVSLDNLIRALDKGNGAQRWKKPLAARPVVGPLRIGDLLVLSALSAELRAVAAANGEAVGKYDLGAELGAAPVFCPGTWLASDLVVAVTVDGTLLMMGRRTAPGVTAWPVLPGTAADTTTPSPPTPTPPPGG